MNVYLHNSKTDSKASWNDSIKEENRILRSPSRPTMDLTELKYALGTPPGDMPGTSPLLQHEYSTRRSKEEVQGSF